MKPNRLSVLELEKKVDLRGMKPRQGILCKYCYCSSEQSGRRLTSFSRAYDDQDEGEVIREGFEPSKFNPITDSEFAVGDDDDEPQNVGRMHEDSAEASTKYGDLDDRHVWNVKDESDA